MKNTLLRFTLLIALVSCLTSCSKDEPTPDYEKLLTAHSWKYGNARMESTDAYMLEQKEIFLMLSQNTEITFNVDGTYEGSEGKGTWEISDDNQKILFDQKSYYKWYWPIHELKSNSLKVSWTTQAVDAEHKVHEAKIYLDLIPQH